MNDQLNFLTTLAEQATAALLSQTTMEVAHAQGWERNGFPLPIKREQPQEDGSIIQQYRPMAILEFVQESLSGEIAARVMRDRAVKAKAEQAVQP